VATAEERSSEPRIGAAWLRDPNPLVRWGGRAWLVVGILVLSWLVLRIAGELRIVLFPLVLALFPAAILAPLVDRMDRGSDRSRTLAALATTVGFVVVVGGVLTLVTWQVSRELGGFSEDLQAVWDQILGAIRRLPGLSDFEPASLFGGGSGEIGSQAASAVRGMVEFAAELFLGIVAVFFYLRDGDRIGAFLTNLFPRRHREDARIIGTRSWETISGYIRGQTVIALFDGVLFAIGLMILGVPLAATLGLIVFLGAYIPVVGSILAGAIGVGVAFVDGGLSQGLIALALIVAIEQTEGNVLAPIVLGRAVELHPLSVLAAITAGAALLGPFGAIIAVPLAASVHHAAKHIRENVA
jgi:putative heme transporter